MTKSLQDKIYLKGKFFGFMMDDSRSISETLDEYNKPILDLKTLGSKLTMKTRPS